MKCIQQGFWHLFLVIPENGFVTGIMFCAQKVGITRDVDASLFQNIANLRTIGDLCKDLGIGAAMTPTAGTAVICGQMWIVLAHGAMAHQQYKMPKTLG